MVAILSGCSKDKNSANTIVNAGLESEPCVLGVSEGQTADASIDAVDEFKTGAFEKEYRVNWLNAVAKTSILETTRVIPLMANVEIFQAKEKGRSSCQSYVHLASMPSDLDRYWAKLTAADDKPGAKSFIGGLYIPQGSEDGISGNQNKAQIIVRRNQSRWTIVHEFMHHNFTLRAEEKGEYSPNQKKRLSELADEIDNSGYFTAIKYRNYDAARRILNEKENQIVELFKIFDSEIVGTSLEEIAIESELRKLYQAKILEYVPESSAKNAAWYIEQSSEKAAEVYTDRITPLLDEFLIPAETYSLPIASRLRALKTKFNSRVNEASRLRWENPSYLDRENSWAKNASESTGEIDAASVAPKAPCGHDRSDEVIEEISNIVDRFKI